MEIKGFVLQPTPAPYAPPKAVEAVVEVAPVVEAEPVVEEVKAVAKGHKKAKAVVEEVVETPVVEAPADGEKPEVAE